MKHLHFTLGLAGGLFLSSNGFAQAPQSSPPSPTNKIVIIEEVVITATHIRGVKDSASPLLIFDREAIEKSGFSTMHQFIESLPQNFRGGLSEGGGGPADALTQSGPNTGNNIEGGNLNFSTGVNLRGLGSSATLVLLNGQRIAPTSSGSSTDISAIPLSAIERIEVLTDGASALYGSDAVGGVVNVILRKNYFGSQTQVRYGTVTDGGSDEQQASQTFGMAWETGSALISYDYYAHGALDARDRSFTRDLPAPTYLLPETDRHSVLLTGQQEITTRASLFGTGLFSTRRSDSITSNDVATQRWINSHHGEAEQLSLMAGASLDMSGSWSANLATGYSSNDTSRRQVQVRGALGSMIFDNRERTSTTSVDLKADGRAFELGGQTVKAAVGAHYRREGYDNGGNVDESRSSKAAFAELLFPFLLNPQRGADSLRLDLSLAARHENYSDFGSSTNPKIGLLLVAPQGVNLRATYGTSFRAPLLSELNGSLQGVLFDLPNRSGGTTLTALAIGANPRLNPEEAETYTVGFDVKPQLLGGLNVSATYFNIRFTDRIEAARAFFDALLDTQYTDILNTDPEPAFLTFLSQQPESFNGSASDWLDAEVLVDNRNLNTAALELSGIDLLLSYELPAAASQWIFALDSSFLLKKDIQLSRSVAARKVLNTVDNPVDLRLRGSVTWNYGPLSASTFVNHTDGYQDVRFTPSVGVASWTTLDLNVRYRLETASRWLANTELSLNVQNLLDKDPPFVRDLDPSRFAAVHFDSANASALGRFIAVQATVGW